jgi:hypothetical protein
MTNSDVDWGAVDAPGVVDYKITLTVANDVENAAKLPLQVLDFVAACVEIDHSHRFFGIGRNNKGIHASRCSVAGSSVTSSAKR